LQIRTEENETRQEVIEKIRAEQIQQGYEPCFGTDRLFTISWMLTNCCKCCYKRECVDTLIGTASVEYQKECPIGGTLDRLMAQGIAGAKAGEALNITIKSTGKVSEEKLKVVVDEARKLSKRGKK
jgi:hypothetical protein